MPGFRGHLEGRGMGIDLVAASAAIHCDRWWNVAREDQAADRRARMAPAGTAWIQP